MCIIYFEDWAANQHVLTYIYNLIFEIFSMPTKLIKNNSWIKMLHLVYWFFYVNYIKYG